MHTKAMIEEIRTHEPNKNLVKHLEKILKQAKIGDVQGMISVCIWDAGTTSTGWSPPPKVYHTRIVSRRMIGELEYLKLDLMSDGRWIERDEFG